MGLLAYYKYADFGVSLFHIFSGSALEEVRSVLPLGISFFTFKAISYLVDIYTDRARLSGYPVHDALYLSFFAQIQSGPLTRYQDLQLQSERGRRRDLFADGVFRFLIGFNKKILLANVLANITNEIFAAPPEGLSAAYAWLGSICYSLQLFFDFAGYSDMAIGLSQMFGYPCAENFDYPYMTESAAKFWRRWHISLSRWFRDYIYIPLGGSRGESKCGVYVNLFVVWILTGIWHGSALNFVVWGLGYFAVIAFERGTNMPKRLKTKAGKLVYRLFTLLFINFQWVIFRSADLKTGLAYVKQMFLFGGSSLADLRTKFLLREYALFLFGAIFLCFPVVPWMKKKLERSREWSVAYEVLLSVIVIGLFVWAVSFVVSRQNHPFAYANF